MLPTSNRVEFNKRICNTRGTTVSRGTTRKVTELYNASRRSRFSKHADMRRPIRFEEKFGDIKYRILKILCCYPEAKTAEDIKRILRQTTFNIDLDLYDINQCITHLVEKEDWTTLTVGHRANCVYWKQSRGWWRNCTGCSMQRPTWETYQLAEPCKFDDTFFQYMQAKNFLICAPNTNYTKETILPPIIQPEVKKEEEEEEKEDIMSPMNPCSFMLMEDECGYQWPLPKIPFTTNEEMPSLDWLDTVFADDYTLHNDSPVESTN